MTQSDTSEMAARILATLEESRSDNIFTLINTVLAPKGDMIEVTRFAAAAMQLLEDRSIELGMESFVPRNETILTDAEAKALITAMNDWFAFDVHSSHWSLKTGDFRSTRYPFIRLTTEGYTQAVKHLKSRGYQWWRQTR